MKRFLLFTVLFIFCAASANSQAQYKFIDFKDAQKPGLVIELPYSEKIVDGAIQDKMGKLGYKAKESKGFNVYRGVSMSELGSSTYDLYFAIDKKSRKEKDMTTVTMLVSTGNENFVTDSANSPLIGNAKQWLNNLVQGVASYDLDQQIIAQDEIVKKEEKRLKNYGDQGDDMQKKKKKLDQEIAQNQKDQEAQAKEVQKQKDLADALRSRKKQN